MNQSQEERPMIDQIGYDDFVNMLHGSAEIIESERQRLSQLDSISGDGDHGTTMSRAMKLVSKAIDQQKSKEIKGLLESVSWNLLGVDGGATGPLLGTLFKGMADSLIEGQQVTVEVFSQMFETGLTLLEEITKARTGDKTLMDALIPAIISLKESAREGKNFLESLKAAEEAARSGAEGTKDLVARFGRAKNLGERTLGYPDPGATSIVLIFKGFYEALLKRRENMGNPIPKTMHALVLTKPGAFEIQQVRVPEPGPYEVLCKVQAVAICGSDPRIVDGTWAGTWPPSYPFIPGHEWAGEIVAVGENASSYRPGDRVAGEAHTGCGYCRYCLRGQYNLCENYGKPETGHRHYGFVSSGAYAQYGVFSIRSIRKIPSGVSFQEATMVDTAGVALHGIELAGISPGGTVAVIGAGPIGIITMRLARILGAGKIIAIDTGDRVAAAVRLAADVAFDFAKEDSVKTVLAATNGLGADEVCECSGAPETFAQSVRMVRKGGRVSLIGIPPDPIVTDLPFNRIVLSEIAIFGSRANPNVTDKVLALISSGRLVVKDLITHIFPLQDFGKGVDIFGKHRDGVIKVVIEPNEAEEVSKPNLSARN